MRVLITVKNNPTQKYLVYLVTKSLIEEVRNLIRDNKHSEALNKAVARGIFERAVLRDEVSSVNADLILSETSASWDAMR